MNGSIWVHKWVHNGSIYECCCNATPILPGSKCSGCGRQSCTVLPKLHMTKGQQHSAAAKMIETSGTRTEVETSARGKWNICKLRRANVTEFATSIVLGGTGLQFLRAPLHPLC